MPANYSPSFAKNVIQRSLTAILDPHPTKSQRRLLVDHFGETCAYCGKRIHVRPKDAHLDHIDSEGPNNISNRLYACEDCNEKEKRDTNWRDFLRAKTSSDEEFEARASLVQQWLDAHADVHVELRSGLQVESKAHIEAAVAEFERSLAAIRAMRPKKRQLKPTER